MKYIKKRESNFVRRNKTFRNKSRLRPRKKNTRRRKKNMRGGGGFSYSTPSYSEGIAGQEALNLNLKNLHANVILNMTNDHFTYKPI